MGWVVSMVICLPCTETLGACDPTLAFQRPGDFAVKIIPLGKFCSPARENFGLPRAMPPATSKVDFKKVLRFDILSS